MFGPAPQSRSVTYVEPLLAARPLRLDDPAPATGWLLVHAPHAPCVWQVRAATWLYEVAWFGAWCFPSFAFGKHDGGLLLGGLLGVVTAFVSAPGANVGQGRSRGAPWALVQRAPAAVLLLGLLAAAAAWYRHAPWGLRGYLVSVLLLGAAELWRTEATVAAVLALGRDDHAREAMARAGVLSAS